MTNTAALTPGASRLTSVPRPRVLLACLMASALGHAALLGHWRDTAAAQSGSQGIVALKPTGHTVTSVRLLDTTPTTVGSQAGLSQQSLAESASTRVDGHSAHVVPGARPDPGPNATTLPLASSLDTAAVEPQQINQRVPAAAAPQPSDGSSGQADADGDDQYLPRRTLDKAPAALAAIDLPYPSEAPLGTYRAVLTLFIDRAGVVQRVRGEGQSLPPSLEDAARQAFLAAHFEPGRKDGQAVRSRIRVEVEYIAEPLVQRSASADSGVDPARP